MDGFVSTLVWFIAGGFIIIEITYRIQIAQFWRRILAFYHMLEICPVLIFVCAFSRSLAGLLIEIGLAEPVAFALGKR